MGKIRQIDEKRDLCSRRAITVELPEFMLRAFQHRLAEANDGAAPEEQVTIEHFVEIQLAEALTIADVAFLERQVPGIGAAVSRWLAEIDGVGRVPHTTQLASTRSGGAAQRAHAFGSRE